MGREEAKSRPHKTGNRKFYEMTSDYSAAGLPGFELANRHNLVGRNALHAPPSRGFPDYPEKPLFLFDKRKGRLPRDLEEFDAYWLVSDRMKVVLQAVDPNGFVFLACDVRSADQGEVPVYWLCDVVRVLDAIDEAQSHLRIWHHEKTGEKFYNLGNAHIRFIKNLIGDVHAFRNAHLDGYVFCDQQLKDACKAGGLKGIKFRDASKLL
jgi:hypothetical protein